MSSIFDIRLKQEIRSAKKNNKSSEKTFVVCPDLNNTKQWYALLYKLDSPYTSGEYIVQINITEDYPLKSPVVKFLTPSGRYIPNTAICIYGVTHFHEEANNAAADICSSVHSIISTLYDFEQGIGSIKTTDDTKRELAQCSKEYNQLNNKKIIDLLDNFR